MINLKKTFTCGQCFRWVEEPDGSWTGIVEGRIYNLKQDGERIIDTISGRDIIDGSGEPTSTDTDLHSYLDLDTDYGTINAYLAGRDEVIKAAIAEGDGIHILRQDFWEALISFIISQNNNIPRIMGCIENLAALAGEYVGTYDGPVCQQADRPATTMTGPTKATADSSANTNASNPQSAAPSHPDKRYYSLPTPKKLASLTVADLAPVRLGYRAPYLIAAAQQFLENPDRPLEDFMGVGPKVANCVELFGKHDMDSFPVDVWVKRVMNRLYGIAESDTKAMHRFAEEYFAPYGGIAQQYLFYYIREQG